MTKRKRVALIEELVDLCFMEIEDVHYGKLPVSKWRELLLEKGRDHVLSEMDRLNLEGDLHLERQMLFMWVSIVDGFLSQLMNKRVPSLEARIRPFEKVAGRCPDLRRISEVVSYAFAEIVAVNKSNLHIEEWEPFMQAGASNIVDSVVGSIRDSVEKKDLTAMYLAIVHWYMMRFAKSTPSRHYSTRWER